MITVELDKWERLHATTVGSWRQLANAGRPDAHGFAGDGTGAHVQGSLAEFAVAKSLNLHWSGVRENPVRLPGDVGRMQVRSTTKPSGRLIVHDRDDDEAVFVFVVADACGYRFDLAGWIRGAAAKRAEWWEDPTGRGRPAFFVPRSALAPVTDLVGLIRQYG